jgi:hypothetical protein
MADTADGSGNIVKSGELWVSIDELVNGQHTIRHVQRLGEMRVWACVPTCAGVLSPPFSRMENSRMHATYTRSIFMR